VGMIHHILKKAWQEEDIETKKYFLNLRILFGIYVYKKKTLKMESENDLSRIVIHFHMVAKKSRKKYFL